MLDNSGWLSSEEPEYDITKSDDDRIYISYILNILLDQPTNKLRVAELKNREVDVFTGVFQGM